MKLMPSLYTALLLSSCSSILQAQTLPIVKVNFIFATSNIQALRNDNLNQMQKEISILNRYFVDQNNKPIFQFKLNQYMDYSQFQQMNCDLHEILQQAKPIQHLEVKKAFNQCFNKQKNTVYMFIYDAYSLKKGHNSVTSWGFNNNNRPFTLIDWERLNYKIQAALPHEMGHAFGLRHVCAAKAKLKDATNIMASSECGSGTGGNRSIGFNSQQLKTISQYYSKLQHLNHSAQ